MRQAGQRRETSHYFGAAFDQQAVDQVLVADVPQAIAQHARAAGKYHLVELVHVVLVLQQRVQELELVVEPGRYAWIDHVAVIRAGDTGDGQPQRQRGQRMDRHRHWAVELVRQFFHRRVVFAEGDHAFEEV